MKSTKPTLDHSAESLQPCTDLRRTPHNHLGLLSKHLSTQRKKIAAALALTTAGLIGCVGPEGPQGPRGINGINGNNGEGGGDTISNDCSAPASSMEMIDSWNKASIYLLDCQRYYYTIEMACPDTFPNDPAMLQQCYDKVQESLNECDYWYTVGLNFVSNRECGAQIINLAATDDPKSFDLYSNFSTADTDNDGIGNYVEYSIGLNPCEEFTHGDCQPSDGELDYDADGKPNATDDDLSCNPDTPEYLGNSCPQ